MWSVIVVALAARVLVPAGAWQEAQRHGDIVVEVRSIKDSGFEEVRASTTVALPVAKVMDLLWARQPAPGVSTTEVLEDRGHERIVYETASAPMVSTRDYVLRFTRDDARRELRFVSIDDARRPPHQDRVRIPHIVGSTVVVADGPDKSRVIHTVYAETGGNVPAWLARAGQRDNMVAFLKVLKERAAKQR
jgi:hypothetical protein